MKDFIIRKFNIKDLKNGFIETISQKWKTSINEKQIEKILKNYNKIFVVEENITKKIIGVSTLHLQYKYIHNFCICGFIEDVVINEKYRGIGLGKKLILKLIENANQIGCYKLVLSCDVKNVEFYEKCGFINKEITMKKYL